MKKLLMGLGLVFFSCQAAAMAITQADIEFLDTATLTSSVGGYWNNTTDPVGDTSNPNPTSAVSGPMPIGDLNGASWVMSPDATATLDLSFSSAFDVADVDLTLLFVGDKGHRGTITLIGNNSFSTPFNLAAGDGYTEWNSVTPPDLVNSITPTELGVFALTIPLGGVGEFTGVKLDISGLSAAPSMVGVTSAVVPVPAAVWLFGSGLIGLVGVARRRKK